MATLNVGAGQTYATVSAAVSAARSGDVIAVQAGTYTNDFATINKDITITGVGGMANFVATVAPPNGKGIFVTNGNVTIEHLSFSGAAVSDMNGAGIRYEGGNLVIVDSYFHHNQDGLLANADPNGTIRIVDSEFAYNGAGDGQSHNIYVNNIASLVIDNSYFHDASVGHQIKSRAQSTTVTNSRIYDGTGTGSYSIDLPNGGKGVIRDNVIQQGQNSDNPAIIHYGGESAAYAGSSLLIADNVVVNDMSSSSARLLSNATTVTGTLSGNSVYGLTSGQIATGSAIASGTTYLSTHPSLDTSSPWLDTGGPGPGPGPGPSPTLGTVGADKLVGTAGADTMTGLAGDDVYIVNHAGDVVVEANGQGTDTVLSSVSYTLLNHVENLTLTGSGNLNGTGNALTNVLIGNSGHNMLSGGGGTDYLYGQAGDDILSGGAAGAAPNQLWGGEGTDTASYVGTTGTLYADVAALAGYVNSMLVDTMNSIENLTGGSGTNTLVGNGGANVLTGGSGIDYLYGQGGDDILIGGGAPAGSTNQLWGGAGNDTASYAATTGVVYADLGVQAGYVGGALVDQMNSIENLTGGSNADTLVGDGGANRLAGGGGADSLWGRGGADVFVFSRYADSNLVTGYDTIGDFVSGVSKLDLRAFATDASHVVIQSDGNSTAVYVEQKAGHFNAATDTAIALVGDHAIAIGDILFS